MCESTLGKVLEPHRFETQGQEKKEDQQQCQEVWRCL